MEGFGPDFDELGRRAAAAYGSHFVRDAEYFGWRYLDSPRDYRCFGAYRGDDLGGVAVVGHTFKHGVSAGFLADLVTAPNGVDETRALLSRAIAEVKGGADALVLLPPPSRAARRALVTSGFAPTNKQLRFIGKPLGRGSSPRREQGRVALHPRGLRLLLMRRVVFVTQQVDPRHPALAATIPKIAALAALVDEVVVLADGAVPGVLPANTRVRTFRSSRKAGRGLRFEAALARELRGLRGGAVVAHMCPIYAVLAAPFVRPLGVPLVLWFTHWRASRLLRAAERVSTAVTSVDERSFPFASTKLRAIGHGIDLSEFPCTSPRDGPGTRLLALGRYSTAKGLDVVLGAVALAGPDVELHVHGPALSEERAPAQEGARAPLGPARARWARRARRRGARAELPGLFAAHDALVNNMRAGAPDKVVYEAAAGCLPVLASNPIFDSLLDPEQRFVRWDPNALADRIGALAGLGTGERTALGRRLRERVAEGHSVQSWARGILDAAGIAA